MCVGNNEFRKSMCSKLKKKKKFRHRVEVVRNKCVNIESSHTICPRCCCIYVDGQEWISCDEGNKWFDRKCASLTNVKLWKQFAVPGVRWTCGCSDKF